MIHILPWYLSTETEYCLCTETNGRHKFLNDWRHRHVPPPTTLKKKVCLGGGAFSTHGGPRYLPIKLTVKCEIVVAQDAVQKIDE